MMGVRIMNNEKPARNDKMALFKFDKSLFIWYKLTTKDRDGYRTVVTNRHLRALGSTNTGIPGLF